MKKFIYSLFAVLCLAGCADRPYVIVQLADVQLGFTAADVSQQNGTEYVNDLSFEIECLERAVAKVNEIKPDAVVFTGDQVHRSWDKEQHDSFMAVVARLDRDIKVFYLPGNHDVVIEEGRVDSSPFTDLYGADRFCHSENGVKLVGVNTNLIKYNDPSEAQQQEWMKEVLKKESPDEVSLIFGHHPFFLTDVAEDEGYFQITRTKRYEYFDLFSELEVDAVYAGHRHSTFDAAHNDIPMKTMTAVGVQLGPDKSAVRVITVFKGEVSDEIVEI